LDLWDVKILIRLQMSHVDRLFLSLIEDYPEPHQMPILDSIIKLQTEGIINIADDDRLTIRHEWIERFIKPDINKPDDTRKNYVYIISYDDKVKIGQTINVKRRLYSLQTASPIKIKLLFYTEQSDIINESILHKMFSKDHLNGEFFRYTPEISQFITERVGICQPNG
jgi:hypothetical protein